MTDTTAAARGDERGRVRDQAAAARSYGRLAGWATLVSSLLSVPSSLLLEPVPDLVDYTATVLGVIIGAIWVVLPWERFNVTVFHLVAVTAALDIALAVRMVTPVYVYFYFLIAIYVAYVYADWRQVAPQLVFLSLLACLPLIYSPEGAREAARVALFAVPVLWIGAWIVSYLRYQLEQKLRAYQRLATETGELAGRIRRSAGGGSGVLR